MFNKLGLWRQNLVAFVADKLSLVNFLRRPLIILLHSFLMIVLDLPGLEALSTAFADVSVLNSVSPQQVQPQQVLVLTPVLTPVTLDVLGLAFLQVVMLVLLVIFKSRVIVESQLTAGTLVGLAVCVSTKKVTEYLGLILADVLDPFVSTELTGVATVRDSLVEVKVG